MKYQMPKDSDKFKQKLVELSKAELKSFKAELSSAKHFNVQAETELDFLFKYTY